MPGYKYTKELLAPIVARCVSYADVCREVGIKPFTGSQTNLAQRVREYDIDISHFKGQAWNKGNFYGPKRPIEDYLIKDSAAKSHWLRKRLIQEGIKEAKCEVCGLTEWNHHPIPLELDHINSDHWDCRLENLQIVCPNCHALETRLRKSLTKQEVIC